MHSGWRTIVTVLDSKDQGLVPECELDHISAVSVACYGDRRLQRRSFAPNTKEDYRRRRMAVEKCGVDEESLR